MQASQMLHSHRVTGSEVTRSRAVFGRPQAVTLVAALSMARTGVGMGNISILSYIVILRPCNNRIVVVLKLSSYCLHIISGVFFYRSKACSS